MVKKEKYHHTGNFLWQVRVYAASLDPWVLTQSQTTNFRLFLAEKVGRQQFHIDENGANLFK